MPDETKSTSETEGTPFPGTQGTAPEADGADRGAVKTEPTTTESKEKERSFSQAEWNKRQSEIDKAFAKKEQQLKAEAADRAKEAEAERAKRLELEERMQQLEDERLIASVEAEGGDVDATKKALAKAADVRRKASEVARKELEVNKRYASVLEATRLVTAKELAKTYNLDDDAVTSLLDEPDPDKMETKALKLAWVGKTAKKDPPPQVIDNGGSGGSGVDFTKLSPSEQFDFIMRNKKYNK